MDCSSHRKIKKVSSQYCVFIQIKIFFFLCFWLGVNNVLVVFLVEYREKKGGRYLVAYDGDAYNHPVVSLPPPSPCLHYYYYWGRASAAIIYLILPLFSFSFPPFFNVIFNRWCFSISDFLFYNSKNKKSLWYYNNKRLLI